MQKLTITVEDAVFAGLHRVVGRGNISRFLNNLAKYHVVAEDLDAAYAEMAADEAREQGAQEWVNAFSGKTLPHETW